MISILERGFRLGKHSRNKARAKSENEPYCVVPLGGGLYETFKSLESVKKPKPKPKPKPKY